MSLNNDMVQEVKVQSSNFAAEYGTGGMNVSGVTKSGTLEVPRRGLRLLARLASSPPTIARTASPARRSRRASISIPAATSAVRSRSATATRRTATSCSSSSPSKWQRQQVDSGSRFTRTYTQAMRNGDFSELLANRGSNLNSIAQLRIPQGFPGAGQPAPNNDMRPYIIADRASTSRACIRCPNYNDPNNLYNYVYSRLEPIEPRPTSRSRFDWNISNNTKAYVRVAREGETTENPARRVVGAVGRRAAVVRTSAPTSASPSPATS